MEYLDDLVTKTLGFMFGELVEVDVGRRGFLSLNSVRARVKINPNKPILMASINNGKNVDPMQSRKVFRICKGCARISRMPKDSGWGKIRSRRR